MTELANDNRLHLGFLRVAHTDQGFVGGLLVTNHLGRPLEFQCTSPVRPNRTQEILYGPTLQSFICAELIGKTLFERLGIKPRVLIVQQDELLDLRKEIKVPMVCLINEPNSGSVLPDQTWSELGRQQVRFHLDHTEDQEVVNLLRSQVPADADLMEPLDRVRDALQETLRMGAVA